MRVTNSKNCYCHTCEKDFHYLGIARHRRGHLDRKEDCKITYTHGATWIHFHTRIINNSDTVKSNKI